MNLQRQSTYAAVKPLRIVYTVQVDDHSAGEEHEIEYSVIAGK